MEEKDININIVTMDNGEIEVQSDIEDCLDYVEVDELVSTIMYLTQKLGERTIEELYTEVQNAKNKEEEQNYIKYNMREIMNNMIYGTMNVLENVYRHHFKMQPEMYEYCLTMLGTKKDDRHYPVTTLNSEEIVVHDLIQSCYMLYGDFAGWLLDNDFEVDEVKELIETTFKDISNFYQKTIDKVVDKPENKEV